jgi:hypothetical protein
MTSWLVGTCAMRANVSACSCSRSSGTVSDEPDARRLPP